MRGLAPCLEGSGGRGGSGLRFLAESGFPVLAGDRNGDRSDGAGQGSTFSLGIRGARCFCDEGVRASEGETLPVLGLPKAFMEMEPAAIPNPSDGEKRRCGKREMRVGGFEFEEVKLIITLQRHIFVPGRARWLFLFKC